MQVKWRATLQVPVVHDGEIWTNGKKCKEDSLSLYESGVSAELDAAKKLNQRAGHCTHTCEITGFAYLSPGGT